MTYYSQLAMERNLRDIEFNRREAYGLFLGILEYVYHGIPRAALLTSESSRVRFRVYDGLEERGEWARPFQIFSDLTRVTIDGIPIAHTYDETTGTISVVHNLPSGPHEARVSLINLHKNSSLPQAISFTTERP
jgi:hypothetical protein